LRRHQAALGANGKIVGVADILLTPGRMSTGETWMPFVYEDGRLSGRWIVKIP
jgi:hypothetical protein